jgi:hypothetical protein
LWGLGLGLEEWGTGEEEFVFGEFVGCVGWDYIVDVLEG